MNPQTETKLCQVLLKTWGYTSFRPMQLEIIDSVLQGHDTLALMPTGGGKSLLYQVPTLATDKGFCIVVTPLISLMKDQVDRLRSRGVSAVAVHSAMTPRQIDIALDNCVYGDVKFLYVSPERLSTEIFRARVERMSPTLIAVDEAHCISQWGYDFRPSYMRIAELRKLLPDVPLLALTASATDNVAEDIMQRLSFRKGALLLRSSFARPNIAYAVRKVEDKNDQLLRVVNNVDGTGIVYVRTREGTEQVAAFLKEHRITAAFYHGGLASAERTLRQEEWTSGKCRVMVATNAFGMGIDKPDVRFVVHYSVCDSLENYYQESGRAGRDGERAYALLLVGPDDKSRAKRMFAAEYPSLEVIKKCYDDIGSYLQVAVGDGDGISYDFNLYEFCKRYRMFTGTAYNAIQILQMNDLLTLTDESEHPTRIMFSVSRDDLYRIRVERDDLNHFLRTIMRMYDGVFTEFRAVSEQEIAQVSGYTVDRVRELLKVLWQMRVIRYIPSRCTPLIVYGQGGRLPLENLYISPETYHIRKQMASERMAAMFAYVDNESECRSTVIRRYFGEPEVEDDCGVCDVCLARRKRSRYNPEIEQAILSAASEALTLRQIIARLDCDPDMVARTVDKLLADDKISVDSLGVLKINR